MIPSKDIAEILVAKIPGLQLGQNVFISQEPTAPDNTITVFDTPGAGSERTIDKLSTYQFVSVQVRVRNTSYEAGMQLVQKIVSALHLLSNTVINGEFYTCILHTSGPSILEYDFNRRCKIVTNFEIQKYAK